MSLDLLAELCYNPSVFRLKENSTAGTSRSAAECVDTAIRMGIQITSFSPLTLSNCTMVSLLVQDGMLHKCNTPVLSLFSASWLHMYDDP